MSKIKICGMQRIEDIKIVNEFLPDFVGFIMSEQDKFRRQIPVNLAAKLRGNLDDFIRPVGVFVDESEEFIADICNNDIIDLIQLHGHEDNDYILRLGRMVRVPIVKAVHVRTSEEIRQAEKLSCQYLLLDTAYDDKAGGGGKKFDWDIIPQKVSKPFFLAGGINADNIQDAVSKVNPYCVDLSSSVETHGYKDREKVREVINKVRRV